MLLLSKAGPRQVFRPLSAPKDVVSLGATVSAYERAFYWQRGLLLLTLFARRSLPLNTVVCSAAIGSCEKAQLQMAMEQNRCVEASCVEGCPGHHGSSEVLGL